MPKWTNDPFTKTVAERPSLIDQLRTKGSCAVVAASLTLQPLSASTAISRIASSPAPAGILLTSAKTEDLDQKLLPLPQGFRLAIARLKGRINLLAAGTINVKWDPSDSWVFEFHNFPDVPDGGLRVRVGKDRIATVTVLTDKSAEEFLKRDGGTGDITGKRMRAQAGFRIAVENFKNWYRADAEFSRASGKIKFHRARTAESWCMEITEYGAMRLGGYWVAVEDDGRAKVTPMLWCARIPYQTPSEQAAYYDTK